MVRLADTTRIAELLMSSTPIKCYPRAEALGIDSWSNCMASSIFWTTLRSARTMGLLWSVASYMTVKYATLEPALLDVTCTLKA